MKARSISSMAHTAAILMANSQTQPVSVIKEKEPIPFVTSTPNARDKYSEPMNIVSIHFDETQRVIRAVGADGNVRVCKIDRLLSIDAARDLWKLLRLAKDTSAIISFVAAGGFSPDKWFYGIVAE